MEPGKRAEKLVYGYNLYTISNKYIKINDLEDNLKELNTIVLPYEENRPYYWGRMY